MLVSHFRLRVSVKDVEKVNKATLKDIGVNVDVLDVKGGIQAIYGAKAILYKNNINEILGCRRLVSKTPLRWTGP